LAKDQHPDYEEFNCEEVVRFLPLDYHVGIVYKSDSKERIQQLLDDAAEKINDHFLNIIPPKSKPSA